MYDELISSLRMHHCDAKEDDTQEVCEECAYDVIIADKSVPSGFASVCVCGLMHRAADAIEELQKRVPKTPHGRLIDADELAKTLGITDMDCFKCAWGNHGFCGRCGDFNDACEAIEDAPTIIPAEESET